MNCNESIEDRNSLKCWRRKLEVNWCEVERTHLGGSKSIKETTLRRAFEQE